MACSIASTSQYQPMTPLQIKQKARDINQQGLEANKSGDTRVALSCFERAHELEKEVAKGIATRAERGRAILREGAGVHRCEEGRRHDLFDGSRCSQYAGRAFGRTPRTYGGARV